MHRTHAQCIDSKTYIIHVNKHKHIHTKYKHHHAHTHTHNHICIQVYSQCILAYTVYTHMHILKRAYTNTDIKHIHILIQHT